MSIQWLPMVTLTSAATVLDIRITGPCLLQGRILTTCAILVLRKDRNAIYHLKQIQHPKGYRGALGALWAVSPQHVQYQGADETITQPKPDGVAHETWPLNGWHHPFVIGWSKYKLGLLQSPWIVGSHDQREFSPFFRGHWQSTSTAPTAGNLPAIRAVQGECETVYEQIWPDWCHLPPDHSPPHNVNNHRDATSHYNSIMAFNCYVFSQAHAL